MEERDNSGGDFFFCSSFIQQTILKAENQRLNKNTHTRENTRHRQICHPVNSNLGRDPLPSSPPSCLLTVS